MQMTEFVSTHRSGGGKVLGFPLEGFGLFTSLLLAFLRFLHPHASQSSRCLAGTSSATTP
jgi:hypothetical protein